jgi:metal-responsive CopG/Arc/MetJ family transcriptional regulator
MRPSLSKKLTITLPPALIEQIDRLALHDFASRSDIIRLAVLKYVREPQNKIIADPDSVAIAKMYEDIKGDHPYLDPNDAELIKFIYEQR